MRMIAALLAMLCSSAALAQTQTYPTTSILAPQLVQAWIRDCVPVAGAATNVACTSASAAASAKLHSWSKYLIQCSTNSYWETGTTSAATATASDLYLPAGSIMTLPTDGTVIYWACLNSTGSAGCNLLECK